ncbi:carbon storage regulator [Sinomonas halotolerans]|uniref:Translational regulator CsrA n=1 Tax=Sinomonas halotolerans TaxID=1644133 RepID=A0ABU9WYN7_9MICC
MLVLTRKSGQSIHLGDGIVLTVQRVSGDSVRIGIEAPQSVQIRRGEVVEAMAAAAGHDEALLRDAVMLLAEQQQAQPAEPLGD